jgi:hypothetical protein
MLLLPHRSTDDCFIPIIGPYLKLIDWPKGAISSLCEPAPSASGMPQSADLISSGRDDRVGRVEDERGSLGYAATLRFSSPLIEPGVPVSRIRLSDWLHREAHGKDH